MMKKFHWAADRPGMSTEEEGAVMIAAATPERSVSSRGVASCSVEAITA